MPNDDLDFLILNDRRLTPAGRSRLQRLVAERAKALRTEFLRGLWRQIRCWHQRRIGVAQLQSLDDAALKDIGLHRSGIEAAVANGLARNSAQRRRTFPEKPQLYLQRTGAAQSC